MKADRTASKIVFFIVLGIFILSTWELFQFATNYNKFVIGSIYMSGYLTFFVALKILEKLNATR